MRNCHLLPRAERSPREGRVLTEQTPGPSHAWESQRIETRNSDRRSVNTAQVVSCLVTSNRSDERRSDKQLCLITTTQKSSPDWPSRVNIITNILYILESNIVNINIYTGPSLSTYLQSISSKCPINWSTAAL